MNKITHKYFDKVYWEKGTKSGYTIQGYNQGDYLNEAKACLLTSVYGVDGVWLEAGCAFGWVVEQLMLKYGVNVYGFDISKYSIKHCPGVVKSGLKQSDGLHLGLYEQNSFDIIYSFETAEHVAEQNVYWWIDSLYKWLKPGGKLFMTICLGHNNIRGLDDNDESHQTLQSRIWWEDYLAKTGFVQDDKSYARALTTVVETEEMSIRGTPENLIEKYNLHLFTWEKPNGLAAI